MPKKPPPQVTESFDDVPPKPLNVIVREEADGIVRACQTEDALLYSLAAMALRHAVQIAMMSRMAQFSAQEFRGHQARLWEAMNRLNRMVRGGEVLRRWPKTPGVTFSWKAGDSALDVALKFSRMILTATRYGRAVTVGPTHGEPPFMMDAGAVEAWRDATVDELKNKTLPPLPNWPVWEIQRDAGRLDSFMYDEYQRTIPGKTSPRGRLVKSESKARQATMLAIITEHPTMKDKPTELAQRLGVSESTVRRWLEALERKYRESAAARAEPSEE